MQYWLDKQLESNIVVFIVMKWTWKSGFLYAISLQISSACFYCFLIWINSDHSPEKRTWGRNRINADCFESYKTYQAENDRYTVYPWYTSLFIPLLSISLDLECRCCRCLKLQVFQISGVSNCRCCKYQPSGAGGTRSPPATPHRLQHLPAHFI